MLYKLFEGSWEAGSVLRDKERGVFIDPDKVHEIGHKGKYFEVPGYHLCEPSPQRTPVLFQAGASGAGKAFAAGRDPSKVLVYALVTVIVDETDEKAQAKFEEYKQHVSYDGALLLSGWSGIDFGQYAPQNPLIAVKRDEHHPAPQDRFTEPAALAEEATPAQAMAHKLKTRAGRALYALRKQTVEPVFGIIKSVLGFRQFSLRGLKKVTGEWTLVCLAWNLKRMDVLRLA